MKTFSIVYEFDQVSEGDSSEQRLLKLILQSLKKSKFQNKCIEFILVTDEQLTPTEKENIASKFSILEFQPNLLFVLSYRPGYYEKKKTGYEESSGEIVIFLDSDCVYSGDYFDQILLGFSSPEIDIVSGRTFALIESRCDLLFALLWQFPIKESNDPRNFIVHQWGNNFATRRNIFELTPFRNLQPSRPFFRVLGFVWDSEIKSSSKRIWVDADAFHKQFSSFGQLARRVFEQGREQQVISKWLKVPVHSRVLQSIKGMGWESTVRISTLRKEMKLGSRIRLNLILGCFVLRAINTFGFLLGIILDRKVTIK